MTTTSLAFRSPSDLTSFSRSQVSSFLATLADYGTLFLATELFHVWYVSATALGAFLGAVINFLINRHWSFNAASGRIGLQAQRYFLVSAGSLLLNTGGVFLMTDYGHLHYAASVGVVSLLVGLLFNYPLHKKYVYRAERS